MFCRSLRAHHPVLLAALLLPTLATSASDERVVAGGERPRIGLALSGGGARGGAHVGVLQVLESHRIPVDYVAGTSMGAIVGGLYATGMSVDAIAETVEAMEWDEFFTDKTSRRERSFRRKRDDDLYLVKSRPGIDAEGLKFPAGVVQGQKIDLALRRLLRHASGVERFDELPVPFRAVATDIATGEAVVLDRGDLTQAIRASMSVPAVFAPTLRDGRKLVDGGVANNLPIDVVRDMGADIVIAVDISTPLLANEQLDSVIAISEQLTNFLTRRNTEVQLDTLTDRDVLLIPDLGDITSASFGRTGEAITAGRDEAERQLGALQRLSLSARRYAAHRDAHGALPTDTPTVDFIRLDNRSRLRDSIVAGRIYDTQVGRPFSVAQAERDVGRIYGLELFQNVGYRLVEDGEQTGLAFYADERSWGPDYLQVGASYNSNTDGDNLFNVALGTLHTGLNASGGELRLGVQFGEEPGGLADYHQPFGARGMWFWNALGFYGERLITIFDDDRALADYELVEASIEGSVGRELGTWGEMRAGLRYADGRATVRIGDPDLNPDVDYQSGEWYARFFVDELDSFYFPREGYFARLQYTGSRPGLGADDNFDQIELTGAIAGSRGRHSLLGDFTYQSTRSGVAPIQSVIRAGGFLNLSGYNEGELTGQHYARLGGAYYYRLGRSSFLPLYVGASLELGNVWQERADIGLDDTRWAGSVFVGADTFIGPLYMAYGDAEGPADAFYLVLGSVF